MILQRLQSQSLSGGFLSIFLGRKSAPSHSSTQNLIKSSVHSILICGTFLTVTSSQFRALIKSKINKMNFISNAYLLNPSITSEMKSVVQYLYGGRYSLHSIVSNWYNSYFERALAPSSFKFILRVSILT